MNVRCPVCSAAVVLAVGDTRLSCTACGLAAPVSRVGTAPGTPASAMLALESDLTGATIAGRKLVERIGAGGMGTVYRARGDSGDVAVKVLRPVLGTDLAAMLARFAREAEAMRRLEHSRVVRFLDHGEEGETAYIVTELVEGKDLAARLAEGRMSLAEIVDVFGQVCDGVAVAHAAGIVHRDLKPANILVGKDGVKVADFGLAQLGADVSVPTLTRTDVAMGTFHYLAPEQRKDARAVDHRADVWALGVILYEMLTGELPLGAFAPPSTNGPPGCDRRMDAIVSRALAPDPAQRYPTVSDLARDVRAIVAPKRVPRRYVAIAAALALVGGGTAAAFALTGKEKPVVASTTPDAAPDAAAIAATIDAAPDAEQVAIADAAVPDAALVVSAPPKPAVGSGGDVKAPVKNPVKAGVGKVAGGKGKTGGGKKFVGGKPGAKSPDVDEVEGGKVEKAPSK